MLNRNIPRLVSALTMGGRRGLVAVLMTFGGLCQVAAQEKDPRPAAGLQDNSFLIEEAYNQEAGVVQHIATLRRQGRDWAFAYTDEWPIGSQTHQFSYTVPYLWLHNDMGGNARGFGDVQLNYRYQALKETANQPAFAPRATLIIPSDSPTSVGSYGVQFNLPVSKIVSDRVTLHGNAGLTSLFDVNGHQPTVYTVGGSAVYAVTRDTNFLIEALGDWITDSPNVEANFVFTLLPGIRHAFNLQAGQLVLGAGVPIVFTEGRSDVGGFFYFSFEHKFR